MGVKYVDDFEFPESAGFTGSRNSPAKHFAKGGRVAKNTSAEFNMKTKRQDDMDHGVQPARRGRNQAEVEAGGTKRMLPEFKEGGRVKGYTMAKKGGRMCYMKGGKAYMMKGGKMTPYKGAAKSLHSKMTKHGKQMGYKEGAQHPYKEGGYAHNAGYHGDPADRNRPSVDEPRGQGEAVRAQGEGKGHKRLSGQTKTANRRNRVSGANRSEGEGVKPAGRGRKTVGGGYAEGGRVGYRTDDPGGYKGAMKGRGKGPKGYAEGGLAAARKVMKQHIAAPKPAGHGVKAKARGGRSHDSTPMYGKYGR